MGPCAKQVVTATLITTHGERFVGRNDCYNPQESCPRDAAGYKTGQGYHLCKEVCDQMGHAEVVACLRAGFPRTKGATIYVEGHTYACQNCLNVARSFEVKEVRISAPPRERTPRKWRLWA